MEWGDNTLYRILNKALRSEDRQALKIWFPYLKLFDAALNKLPPVKEVVWRGIPLEIGKSFTKNQIVAWWSVNSSVNGKKVSGYTEYENEDEILLRMGSQFRVKSDCLEESKDSQVVHLIEVNNDDDNDQPSASSINNVSSVATLSHKHISSTLYL
ncbi:unnamed protein product [Adineta steineri]|uniref:Mono(ADP-ribosyl)transferase n=3 Tax=Adineta steineri TaxID=433720 RepID=A0A813MNK2_9BILA|nr:unnamed protein product [Adineta steineri]CAF1383649.1 unnamed protein product [Adineta steineri]CAF4002375.1 unnamed protein product [Adineta steineri]